MKPQHVWNKYQIHDCTVTKMIMWTPNPQIPQNDSTMWPIHKRDIMEVKGTCWTSLTNHIQDYLYLEVQWDRASQLLSVTKDFLQNSFSQYSHTQSVVVSLSSIVIFLLWFPQYFFLSPFPLLTCFSYLLQPSLSQSSLLLRSFPPAPLLPPSFTYLSLHYLIE